MKRVVSVVLVLSFNGPAGPAVHLAVAGDAVVESGGATTTVQTGPRELVTFSENAQAPDGGLEPTISVRRLIGMQVTNPLNERIGEVADILVDRYGCPAGMIIRIGGFMGFGGEYVGIEIDKVNIRPQSGSGSMTVLVRETRQNMLSGE